MGVEVDRHRWSIPQPPFRPPSPISLKIEKAKLATATTEIGAKITQWQQTSQGELLAVQPQYTPGQVAYQHEVEELAAETAKQNALGDEILFDAEIRLNAILTPRRRSGKRHS